LLLRSSLPAVLVLLLLSGTLKASPAVADDRNFYNCEWLQRRCRGWSGEVVRDVDGGLCIGFLSGVIEAEKALSLSRYYEEHPEAKQRREPPPVSERLFCHPSPMTTQQLVAVVLAYIEKHPEYLHFPAAACTILAMLDAFPCTGAE
jgi:Rap1a immunity proteins